MEGAAVLGSEAEAADGLYMFGGWVAHVVLPSVTGIPGGEGSHLFVPVSFCEDGGRGYAGVGGVAMHYGKI